MKPPGLRIIGGRLKGQRLKSIPGRSVRPTANRIRESIFNILSDRIENQDVADLFAGTGALGIEALSRGAASAIFIDHDAGAIATLRHNVARLGLERQAQIRRWNILTNLNCLQFLERRLGLIFLDPPYHQNMLGPALQHLSSSKSVQPDAMIVVEHSQREMLPQNDTPFVLYDQRRYGKTLVSFLKYMV